MIPYVICLSILPHTKVVCLPSFYYSAFFSFLWETGTFCKMRSAFFNTPLMFLCTIINFSSTWAWNVSYRIGTEKVRRTPEVKSRNGVKIMFDGMKTCWDMKRMLTNVYQCKKVKQTTNKGNQPQTESNLKVLSQITEAIKNIIVEWVREISRNCTKIIVLKFPSTAISCKVDKTVLIRNRISSAARRADSSDMSRLGIGGRGLQVKQTSSNCTEIRNCTLILRKRKYWSM